MVEAEATEATINMIYKSYYVEMGGAGEPPEVPAQSNNKATNNVTAFKRPPAQRKPTARQATQVPGAKPRLPVALIFASLAVVYVAITSFCQCNHAPPPRTGP